MEKRTYELTLLMPSDTAEKDIKAVVTEALSKAGGELVKFDFWGKKDLAYPIKKKNQAAYGYFELSMASNEAVELGNRLRLNESVMRNLLVIKNNKEAKKESRKK